MLKKVVCDLALCTTMHEGPKKAEILYKKACDMNEAMACANLGLLKQKGRSSLNSMDYYHKACALGSVTGCSMQWKVMNSLSFKDIYSQMDSYAQRQFPKKAMSMFMIPPHITILNDSRTACFNSKMIGGRPQDQQVGNDHIHSELMKYYKASILETCYTYLNALDKYVKKSENKSNQRKKL